MFDSLNGRTCLHHASYYGYSDCLQLILSEAQTASLAESWYAFIYLFIYWLSVAGLQLVRLYIISQYLNLSLNFKGDLQDL